MTEGIRAWRNKHNYFILRGIVFPAKPARRIGSTTPAMPDDTPSAVLLSSRQSQERDRTTSIWICSPRDSVVA
jgi:hypothetical protein